MPGEYLMFYHDLLIVDDIRTHTITISFFNLKKTTGQYELISNHNHSNMEINTGASHDAPVSFYPSSHHGRCGTGFSSTIQYRSMQSRSLLLKMAQQSLSGPKTLALNLLPSNVFFRNFIAERASSQVGKFRRMMIRWSYSLRPTLPVVSRLMT